MTWNHDISQAPRGQTFKTEQMRCSSKGEVTVVTEQFVPDWIWAATEGGEVIKSHFVPGTKHHPEGRWLNLHSASQPIAWQPFEKPAHPHSPTETDRSAQ